ncbi:PQQ-binding-like beta-propeller repeat protein [Haladaptatus sp. DFWS20]|uniref:PQQ-binding-like beta-propeller repeat protein n=1 Tax=Haladaptatus sp. DFWS20 TaxID=3403467 RepID=UPI003EB85024
MSDWSPTRRDFVRNAATGVPLGSAIDQLPPERFVPEPSTVWTHPVSDRPVRILGIEQGTLYAKSEETVHALSAKNGLEYWRFEAEKGRLDVHATAGTVFVENVKSIYTLSATDGSERWRYDGKRFPRVQFVVDDNVIVSDERLLALSLNDGATEWRIDPQNAITHAPLRHGDYLFVGTSEAKLYAVSARSGAFIWLNEIGQRGSSSSRLLPVGATDERVFAWNSDDAELFAFTTENGAKRWEFDAKENVVKFGDSQFFGAIRKDAVFLADRGNLRVLSAADGTERWRATIDAKTNWSPRLFGDTVYAGVPGRLRAFSARGGNQRWQMSVDADLTPTAIGATNDSVVVHTTGGSGQSIYDSIRALSPSDGHVRWQYEPSADVAWNPHVADETVYFSTVGGAIHALTDPGSTPVYDVVRTATSPLGLATGVLLGGAAVAGAYRRYRGEDAIESDETGVPMWNGYVLHDRIHDETTLARVPGEESVLLRRFEGQPSNFEQDARAWDSLDFDGVQRLHDWGDDPEPWIALERVEGRTLAELCGSLDQHEIIRTVARTAEIVHRAHKRDVAHEDLTAENVVMTESGVTVTNWRFTGADESQVSTTEETVSRLGNLAESVLAESGAEISEPLSDVLRRATASAPDEQYDSTLKFADMLRWAGRASR